MISDEVVSRDLLKRLSMAGFFRPTKKTLPVPKCDFPPSMLTGPRSGLIDPPPTPNCLHHQSRPPRSRLRTCFCKGFLRETVRERLLTRRTKIGMRLVWLSSLIPSPLPSTLPRTGAPRHGGRGPLLPRRAVGVLRAAGHDSLPDLSDRGCCPPASRPSSIPPTSPYPITLP